MIIYYLAAIYPKKYQGMINEEKMISPAYKFNKLLAEGFSVIPNVQVRCIVPKVFLDTLPAENRYGQESEDGLIYIYADSGERKCSYVSFLKFAANEIRIAERSERVLLICDALSLNLSFLCLWMKMFYKITNVAIITDFPTYIGAASKKLTGRLWGKMCMGLMRKYDNYVLLTEQMGEYINKRKKPECIMEGVCDIRDNVGSKIKPQKSEKKVCLYAGSLHREYGIKMLIEAFMQINILDCELHLYGDGNYREQVEEICNRNENIYYYGVKSNEYIIEQERKATLLINPRPTSDEYAKYSFPSKTLEYMVSGTPVLMTRLPGLPESYYPYVYLFEEESIMGYRAGLEKALSKTEDELFRMGDDARCFVIENKCAAKQARKIYEELKLGEEKMCQGF